MKDSKPSKRPKAAEPAPGAPAPKKRVTRSSTKANATAQEEPQSNADVQEEELEFDAAEAVAKAPRSSKPKTTKTRANKNQQEQKPSNEAEDPKGSTESSTSDSTPKYLTTSTINHDSLKKPIQCHHYSISATPSTPSPTLIFTHGAGGTLSAPAVTNFCTGYATTAPILAFQGSMNLAARVKGFHACIERLESQRQEYDEQEREHEATLVLGGRSMGARAAVMTASEMLASSTGTEEPEVGDVRSSVKKIKLILVSYPLLGPKNDIRDQILLDLPSTVDVLFVTGSRDAMCPLELLATVRSKMAASSTLVTVKGADHGMHVRPVALEKELGERAGGLAAKWTDAGFEDGVEIGEEG
ncbi:hypothetical protein BDV95DRAFT_579612 [Massariosphaeria phaeospora]|uniref:KANL3/Tex30 alpha/beta hydrolase-like domain-containing protein n=1 Tax=Massariosphaeria phaeospora TaxID=100035 RepID=A0A7C8I1H7_9PLEO|nr:hypothetical protein BDV95DRAFT_579612 [Massariosphaeria phaeospora]